MFLYYAKRIYIDIKFNTQKTLLSLNTLCFVSSNVYYILPKIRFSKEVL